MIKSKNREWDILSDQHKLDHIITRHLGGTMSAKTESQEFPVFLYKRRDDGSFIFSTAHDVPEGTDKFTITKTLKKQVEVDFRIFSKKDKMLLVKPVAARLAKFDRKFPRLAIKEETAYAANFLITPREIDLNKITGVTGQMLLGNLHKTLKTGFPESTLVFFDKAPIATEINAMKLHKLPLIIPDTETMKSSQNHKCFDITETWAAGNSLDDIQESYRKNKIRSVVYFPVFFNNSGYQMPVGFFHFEGKGVLPDGLIEEYTRLEEEYNNSILGSCQKEVNCKQEMLNISEGGALLKITDPELIESLLHRPRFSFDIVFKKQNPLRFFASICHIKKAEESIIIGTMFEGASDSKKNMDKLRTFLKLFSEQ